MPNAFRTGRANIAQNSKSKLILFRCRKAFIRSLRGNRYKLRVKICHFGQRLLQSPQFQIAVGHEPPR
jgi:hypothetical protein